MSERTSRVYRIAELMTRYRPQLDGKVWRYADCEAGGLSVATYADERTAAAGARLQAALDIAGLFDALADEEAGGR